MPTFSRIGPDVSLAAFSETAIAEIRVTCTQYGRA